MTSFEDVIRDAALKNRASVKEDDPVMVVVTVMNRVVDDQIKALTAAHEQHRTISQEVALAWRKDATDRANQILNAALDASRKAMAKGMNEGAAKVVALVREECAAAVAEQRMELEKSIADFRRYASMVTYAIGVGLVGAVLIAVLL